MKGDIEKILNDSFENFKKKHWKTLTTSQLETLYQFIKETSEERVYTVLLMDGTSELIKGSSPDHALNTNGYFHTRHHVSMIAEGSVQHEYEWNNIVKTWEQKLEYRDEL